MVSSKCRLNIGSGMKKFKSISKNSGSEPNGNNWETGACVWLALQMARDVQPSNYDVWYHENVDRRGLRTVLIRRTSWWLVHLCRQYTNVGYLVDWLSYWSWASLAGQSSVLKPNQSWIHLGWRLPREAINPEDKKKLADVGLDCVVCALSIHQIQPLTKGRPENEEKELWVPLNLNQQISNFVKVKGEYPGLQGVFVDVDGVPLERWDINAEPSVDIEDSESSSEDPVIVDRIFRRVDDSWEDVTSSEDE